MTLRKTVATDRVPFGFDFYLWQAALDALGRALDREEQLSAAKGEANDAAVREYTLVPSLYATTHVMCAAALEAHVNSLASAELREPVYAEFERFGLVGKWLFLPAALGRDPFAVDREPFQSFNALVRFRNALMHGKPEWFAWSNEIPELHRKHLDKLGLKREHAEQSVKATRGMVVELADRFETVPKSFWTREVTRPKR